MKKGIFRILAGLAICLGILVFITERPAEAATVKLNKSKATLDLEEKVKLKVKNTKKTVKWSSSNKKVARVSKLGNVYAVSVGKCTITAKVGKKKYTCKITVTDSIGALLDDSVSLAGFTIPKSSKWEQMDMDAIDIEDFYSFRIDKNVFKDITVQINPMQEKEYDAYTASEDNFKYACAVFKEKAMISFETQTVSYEVIKTDVGFVGKITASFVKDKTNYSLTEYIRMADSKLITVMGMETGNPTSFLDRITKRVCLEIK